MSEILTSREIEDVLSSIRRLVSEDLSPGAGKRISARARRAAREEEEKLLLTPSLRVVADNSGMMMREDVAALSPEAAAPVPVVDPETGLAVQGGEVTARAALRGPSLHLVDAGLGFPAAAGPVSLVPGDRAGDYLEDEVWAEPGLTEDEEALLLAEDDGDPAAVIVPEVDWFGDAPETDHAAAALLADEAPELVAGIRSVLAEDATAAAMLAASLPEGGALGVLALMPEDRADAVPAVGPGAETIAEALAGRSAPDQSIPDADMAAPVVSVEPGVQVADAAAAPSTEEETAMIGLSGEPQAHEHPPRVVDMRKAHEAEPGPLVSGAEIDEAYLRELVLGIIREELSGTLGERITRSVRKLVRAELARALTSRDFE